MRILFTKALRREGAFAVDGHGRLVRHLQTGALRAADKGVPGTLRQLDARGRAGLDLEGAAVAVGIAAHVDLDARERDVRVVLAETKMRLSCVFETPSFMDTTMGVPVLSSRTLLP